MSAPTPVTDRAISTVHRNGPTSTRSIVLTALLVLMTLFGIWTVAATLGHAINTCLGTPAAAGASPTPAVAAPAPSAGTPAGSTTNTNVCMSGEIVLAPTNITIKGVPIVLVLVVLPWVVVFALLWMIAKGIFMPYGVAIDESLAYAGAGRYSLLSPPGWTRYIAWIGAIGLVISVVLLVLILVRGV